MKDFLDTLIKDFELKNEEIKRIIRNENINLQIQNLEIVRQKLLDLIYQLKEISVD